MVFTDRIQLKIYIHNNKEHSYIWFVKEHAHSADTAFIFVFRIGVLIGNREIREMLITLIVYFIKVLKI